MKVKLKGSRSVPAWFLLGSGRFLLGSGRFLLGSARFLLGSARFWWVHVLVTAQHKFIPGSEVHIKIVETIIIIINLYLNLVPLKITIK